LFHFNPFLGALAFLVFGTKGGDEKVRTGDPSVDGDVRAGLRGVWSDGDKRALGRAPWAQKVWLIQLQLLEPHRCENIREKLLHLLRI